jgi:hypothetical protein
VRRQVALLVLIVSLLAAGDARAALVPGLLPALTPPQLLTEIGEPVPPPPTFRAGFSIPHAKGYAVKVFTYGSAVILEVSRGGRRHFSTTAYLARGVATPHRLQATFGRFGKVSMRFRPPKEGGVKSLCRFGEKFSQRHGSFVGHLTFKGENGYLSLDLHRASGSILTPAGRCRRHHLSPQEVERIIESLFEPTAGLFATSREGVTTTSFLGLKRKDRTVFFAAHEETHGKLAIVRFAAVTAAAGIHANDAATAAKASAPAPFHGTGHYRAAPDGTATWTGSLSANFPGAPRLPLAGPDFDVELEAPF